MRFKRETLTWIDFLYYIYRNKERCYNVIKIMHLEIRMNINSKLIIKHKGEETNELEIR